MNKFGIYMWGLVSIDLIPAGSLVAEYTGEVLTKREGDKRGHFYDLEGMSYLFDLNDPYDDD